MVDHLMRMLILTLLMFLVYGLPTAAWAVKDFNIKDSARSFLFVSGTSGNVGLGTSTPQSAFILANKGVGIGTWATDSSSALIVIGGNVGIGSGWPGAHMDIQGDLRVSGVIGGSISSPAAALELPQQAVFNSSSGNTGIGTTLTSSASMARLAVLGGNVGVGTIFPQGRFVVYQGNVGVGTFAPRAFFDVTPASPNSAFLIDADGYIGLGTTYLGMQGFIIMSGNMGIGTWKPSTLLTVKNGSMGFNVGSNGVSAGNSPDATNGAFSFNSSAASGLYAFGAVQGTASGDYSMATSAGSATGDKSFSSSGTASGLCSSSLGGSTNNNASGTMSSILGGEQAIASAYGVTSVGRQNASAGTAASWVSTESVFDVGTGGSAATRTSPFTVLKNGSVGVGTWRPAAHLNINGAVGIGTAHSLFERTIPPAGGMIIEGRVGMGTFSPQTGLSVVGNVGIGTWTAVGGSLIVRGGGNVGVSSAWPGALLDVQGTVRSTGLVATGFINIAVTSKTSDYTATSSDQLILVNSTGGAVTINLPAAAGAAGAVYHIKKTDASGNNVIVDPNGAETVDGAATSTMNTQYQKVTVVSTGTAWCTI